MNAIVEFTLLALVGEMFVTADLAGTQQHVANHSVVGGWALSSKTACQGADTAALAGPIAVCTTEELEELFALANQRDSFDSYALPVTVPSIRGRNTAPVCQIHLRYSRFYPVERSQNR